MPSTIIYSSSSPPLHAWTRLVVVYVTVCRHLWKSSIIRVVAQRNTRQSEHASESKIAFEVQHRKHPNMASQVLFQETCYLLLPLVPRTLPPLPLTLTLLFFFFFFCSLITGSAPHLCPATLGLLPETRGPAGPLSSHIIGPHPGIHTMSPDVLRAVACHEKIKKK